jgi:hypothetical protein
MLNMKWHVKKLGILSLSTSASSASSIPPNSPFRTRIQSWNNRLSKYEDVHSVLPHINNNKLSTSCLEHWHMSTPNIKFSH